MLRLQVLSDLHTEFFSDIQTLEKVLSALLDEQSKDTTLIVAGDLGAPCLYRKDNIFATLYTVAMDFFASNYKEVLLVAGNHEYYGSSLPEMNDWLRERCAQYPNIHFLNNSTVERNSHIFIGGTGWFTYTPANMFSWEGMTDSVRNMTTLSELEYEGGKAGRFIYNQVVAANRQNKKSVVITHMALSNRSIPKEFKGSRLNCFYVNELPLKLLQQHELATNKALEYPVLLVNGHTHTSFDYQLPVGSKVVCNPFGYWNRATNRQFEYDKIIEL